MSQVYNLEPPTKGQVVLHTSHGDVEVELWPHEAPKAVRNFTQLCMEGYYDGTIFHRVIKEFMIQGGDPTGTGRGGDSIYGRPFKNEVHSRLRFTRRGLVACANNGESDSSNGSQFFITTERADELTRKYTIFGRISGETIFTVLRMQEVEVDDKDRPTDPPMITSCDVLLPPFDDIVPRTTPAEKREKAAAAMQAEKLADIQKRKKQGKKLNVLSFGDEAEDEFDSGDEGPNGLRYRSAHETLREDSKLQHAEVGVHDEHVAQLQQRLLDEQKDKAQRDAAAAADAAHSTELDEVDEDEAQRAAKFAAAMRDKMRGRGTTAGAGTSGAAAGAAGGGDGGGSSQQDEEGGGSGAAPGGQGGVDAPQRDKIDKLKLTAQGKGAASERRRQQEIPDAQLLTRFQHTLAEHRQRKRARGTQEADVLGKLRDFKSKMKAGRNWQPLKSIKKVADSDSNCNIGGPAPEKQNASPDDKDKGEHAAAPATAAGDETEAVAAVGTKEKEGGGEKEAYDGKVNKDIDHRAYLPAAWRIDSYQDDSEEDEEDNRLASLASHSINWSANDRVADPNTRRENPDDYKVIDPLLEQGKAAFNKKQQHAKKRASEWAGRPNM